MSLGLNLYNSGLVLAAGGGAQFLNTYSLDFDGVDDYVDVGITTTGTNNVSVSCWINTTETFPSTASRCAFGGTDSTFGSNYTLGRLGSAFSSPNDMKVRVFNTLGSTKLNDGNWHNIIYTYDYTTKEVKVYVDGNTTPEISATFSLFTSKKIAIGWNGATSAFSFQGNVDECALWYSVLGVSDISAIYNSGVPTDLTDLSPLAWYRMGDNGSYKSPQWLIPSNENKDKVSNYSFDFDGVGDYVIAPLDGTSTGGVLPILDSDINLTVSLWFKRADTAVKGIFQWGNTLTDGSPFILIRSTSLGWQVYLDGTYIFSGNSSVGDWVNLIITRDSVTNIWTVYANGMLVSTYDDGGTALSNRSSAQDIYLGNGYPNYFNGNIDEVAIWNTDETANIATIYNGGEPTTISGAIAHYKMGEEANFTSNWLVDNSALDNYSKRSFAFDGLDDKIELSTQSLGITAAISVSAWVKIPSTNTGGASPNIQEIVCEDAAGGTARNWAFNWRGGSQNTFGGVIWDSGGSAAAATTNAIVPNDNQWHHVMFTYSGDTSTNGLKLFVDGIQRAQATSANGGLRSTTAVKPTIGSLSNSVQWMFEGNIDEVSIFNTDQSANASTIYNDGIPNNLTDLSPLHWYRMGEDASFNGTNWTIPDNVGSNNGTSSAMMIDSLVGEASNYSGGGISNAMTIEDRIGEAPNSTSNSVSINMDEVDRVTDVPT